ncbi:Uncharacterised protein [Halioglobus japonicus]|nr:Uncharacterised protein [Halioglobus japonicus]
MSRRPIQLFAIVGSLAMTLLQLHDESSASYAATAANRFETISEFKVDGNAEIMQAAAGGRYLVHTNSTQSSIDVVDLTDPANAKTVVSLDMPGEPTSVGVSPDGNWALAVVYASKPKAAKKPIDPRLPGVLALIDLRDPANASVSSLMGIGHHPDSIAVTRSGDDLVGVIAIENEPLIVVDGKVVASDAPGHPNDISEKGAIQIVTINPANPQHYRLTTLPLEETLLRNAQMLNINDPQPEYVAIAHSKQLAAVSLQENNGIVLVDYLAGKITGAFNLGIASPRPADLQNDGNVKLVQSYPTDATTQPLAGTRFPDAISFTPDGEFILSADEGELSLTGGRGFSIWTLNGEFVWDDGGEIERRANELGLYPDERSDVRGIEVEGITSARFGARDYAFAVSERGSFVVIYDISDPRAPEFVQILPTGKGPESVVAIAQRNLVAVAAEKGGSITVIGHIADTP